MLRLRDDQWERIRDHFPEEHIPEGRPGPTRYRRAVLEAVLWILNTGAQWHMLPPGDPKTKRGIAGSSRGAHAKRSVRSSRNWRRRCARKGPSTSAKASSRTRRGRRPEAGPCERQASGRARGDQAIESQYPDSCPCHQAGTGTPGCHIASRDETANCLR
ncbi:MAG: hypothetical protein C4294_04225 [Nitrospiraceae bacterium]